MSKEYKMAGRLVATNKSAKKMKEGMHRTLVGGVLYSREPLHDLDAPDWEMLEVEVTVRVVRRHRNVMPIGSLEDVIFELGNNEAWGIEDGNTEGPYAKG